MAWDFEVYSGLFSRSSWKSLRSLTDNCSFMVHPCQSCARSRFASPAATAALGAAVRSARAFYELKNNVPTAPCACCMSRSPSAPDPSVHLGAAPPPPRHLRHGLASKPQSLLTAFMMDRFSSVPDGACFFSVGFCRSSFRNRSLSV